MIRNCAAVFLLSLLLVAITATSPLYGADKPVKRFADRATFPARFAPRYAFDGIGSAAFAAPKETGQVSLGEVSSTAIGTQLGTTSYEFQHNGSMGRMVEHRQTDFIHFAWMTQTAFAVAGDRGIAAQSYDLQNCDLQFQPAKRMSVDYAGYANLDAAPNGCAIGSGHEGPDNPSQTPRAYWDYCSGGPMGLFLSDAPTDIFGWWDNNGAGPDNQNSWPKIDYQIGTETILHMVACEYTSNTRGPQTFSYYRRVGAYGTGQGTWSSQKVVDTIVGVNPVVTSSATTDKVAIAWVAPCAYLEGQGSDIEYRGQYENDVYYVTSDSQGGDWMTVSGSLGHAIDVGTVPGGNITQYTPTGFYRAYCNVSALITSDNSLHIVWGCRRWVDSLTLNRRQSAIFHWSEDHPTIRTVARAEWDTGGACYAPAWGSDADKMSISECDGKLYVLYAQFGKAASPCVDYGASGKFMNGELYMTVSDDAGWNWDRPQNLTNSPSPNCAAGNCESDYWPAMVRFGRTERCGPLSGQKVLDVMYINDKSAGTALRGEGAWTTNPVMWFPTPCRNVVPEPLYNDDAGAGYGECYAPLPLVVRPGHDTTVTLTMENAGLLANNWSLATNPVVSWVTATPSSGTLPCCGGVQPVSLKFSAPSGAGDPSMNRTTIVVTHQAIGGPRNIPVCLMVASDFDYPQSAVLATACKRLKVYNTGELGNNAPREALDFLDDCDTFNVNTTSNIYLYDGSPVVCRIRGSDTLRFTMYSKNFTDEDALRPLTPLTVTTTGADYDYATARFATADTTIGFTVEYYAPKSEATCSFMIEKLRFYLLKATPLSGVLVGEIIDWDVPSDSASNNHSGYDTGRKLLYQIGAEYGQDDSTEALCSQESDARYGGIAAGPTTTFKNAMTLDNATYVYSTGPYSNLAPWPAGATYRLMKEKSGFSRWEDRLPAPPAESLATDLSTLVTFGEYNFTTADTFCVVKILTTSKTGLEYLRGMVDEALAFITAHPEINCPSGPVNCCNRAGDANNDNAVNVGDAVSIINYVFKGGPAPVCRQEGDANADGAVNVGDAVYVINYVFKSGPAPKCGS